MKKRWLLLFFFIHNTFLAHPDFIESFKIINKNKIIVKANKAFSKQFIKEDFFAEYDENIDLTKLDESIVTIPFILSIIPVVWFSNEIYVIDVMDKDLYYSLQKINEVFRTFYPKHKWAGKLIPKKLVTNIITSSTDPNKADFSLLFTGGLDSVEASISHVDKKQLLITVWGADVKVSESNKWAQILKQCKKFSQTYDHEHVFVKTNIKEFIETPYLCEKFPLWWLHVSHGLALIGITSPFLVSYNIPILLIASTHLAEHPYECGSHPAIDNNISFAGSIVYHTGSDKDRVQKVMSINAVCKEKKLPFPCLRVCWLDPSGKNCLKCEKCIRTYTSIIVAGQLPQKYGFDIGMKRAIRKIQNFLFLSKYLSPAHIYHWQRIVSHLDGSLLECTKNNLAFLKKSIKKLQSFLYSINFNRFKNSHVHIYSSQEHELFLKLWMENMKEIKI